MRVGENFAPIAAVSAAARNSGCPLTVLADVTLPSSSMTTCMLTEPPALTALAAAGYSGSGSDLAFPFNTPPLTVPGTYSALVTVLIAEADPATKL